VLDETDDAPGQDKQHENGRHIIVGVAGEETKPRHQSESGGADEPARRATGEHVDGGE